MDSTTWSVSAKKRRYSPSATFTGRKRQRWNGIISAESSRQQTLTQAQWINTPSSFSVDVARTSRQDLRMTRAKKSKPNSTLTQMDFFARPVAKDPEEDGLAMIGEIEPISQVDGPYQSPRRPRKRKSVPIIETESKDSQEYKPPKKSRKNRADEEAGCASRRPSRRIADQKLVLSDPAENLEYFNKALESDPVTPEKKIEIQDSTAGTDICDMAIQSPMKTDTQHRSERPSRIPSSQTPDSFPSTMSKSEARHPLRETSYNARAPPSTPVVYQYSPFSKNKVTNASRMTLNKSGKAIPNETVDDSQSRLWSTQATLSPRRALSPTDPLEWQPFAPELRSAGRSVKESIEVPSTSQIQPENQTPTEQTTSASPMEEVSQWVAPEIEFHAPEKQSKDVATSLTGEVGERSVDVQPATTVSAYEAQISLRTPAQAVSPQRSLEEQIPRPPSSAALSSVSKPIKSITEEAEDSASDFGSPIRNDTQFNQDVNERTSSPFAAGTVSIYRESGRQAEPSLQYNLSRKTSVPPPVERDNSDSSKDSVPLPPLPCPPSALHRGYTTTRVPLNDTLSSSAVPLPSTKSATQRSVWPASMPHPSQLSTQEATQGYVGSSFMPTETPRSTQTVTVKDSSSIRMPMSQIPRHTDPQSQLNIDFGLDDLGTTEQDEEAYDLDPPSSDTRPQAFSTPIIVRKASKIMIPTEPISSPTSSPSPTPKSAVKELHLPLAQGHRTAESVNVQSERPGPSVAARDPRLRSTSKNAPTKVVELGSPTSPRLRHSINGMEYQHAADQKSRHDHADDHCAPPYDPPSSPPRLSPSPSPSPKSSPPTALARPLDEYTPLPGYNNETQSNFTQGGHVSAAYVHRQREAGILPKWYTPKCVKVPGYTRR